MANSTLRTLRFFRGLTLDDLSRKTNIDLATLSRLERDLLRDTPGSRRIKERVAEALGLPTREVFADYKIEIPKAK